MGRFRRYPEYRDSGVQWLGEIPQHWKMRQAKWLFREVNDRNHPTEPLLSVTQTSGVLPRDESEIRVWNPGDDVSGYKLVLPGDFVISLRSFQGGIEFSDCRGILSPAYTVLRQTNQMEARFLRQLLKSEPVISALNAVTTGIRQGKNISFDDFAELPCPIIPEEEQRSIAAFLDRETAKIDALIEKKERLIELLQEKRTALITHAVSKGLDPGVPMKDSGVDWLGEIPAHWEARALSQFLIRITYGFTNPMPVADDGPFMLTANDIGDGEILYESARRTSESAFNRDLTAKSKPLTDDILITKDGTLGRVAVADGRRACINQSVALLRIESKSADVDFVQNALRAAVYQDRMIFEAGGTTIKHIYISRLAKMPLALPPRNEQQKICRFVNQQRRRIDLLISRVNSGVDRLKEYRTALISAAVTGKIDVREEVA